MTLTPSASSHPAGTAPPSASPLGFALGMGIVVAVRALYGWDPLVRLGRDHHRRRPGRRAVRLPDRDRLLRLLVPLGLRRARRSPRTTPATAPTRWQDYFRVNTDHKVIGIQYICTTFFFFMAGGLMAMLMRAELAQPGTQFVDPNTFNGLFSVHASLMIFLFIIPVFAGIANYVIPLMIGAPDMAFPRLNALSFWMLPIAGVMMLARFFAEGGAFATGWTAYAPLSTETPLGQQFFTLGVQFAGASSIATALNFLVTIITMRAPGMTFWRMPLLVWANFTTSLLVVIATPFIAGSQFFVLLDRTLGTQLLRPVSGRRRADVPARLLVLLAPGRLHHDAAGLRDHQRGHLDARPEADLRLPDDGVLAGGDRDPRASRSGRTTCSSRACRAGCASR